MTAADARARETEGTEPAARKWRFKPGDRYQVVIRQAWMNEHGSGFNYRTAGDLGTHPAAIRAGFRAAESDDFNIAVIRDGALVAVLWMTEHIGDDLSDWADLAEQCGYTLDERSDHA